MYNIGIFKVHKRVAIGMSRPKVVQRNLLRAYFATPLFLVICRIWQKYIG